MTIAGRFQEALLGAEEPALAGPELLPVRLARAAARMLQVDGAGVTLRDPIGRRSLLGAGSDAAAVAERLQFTTGEGPCISAQDTGQPVFAVEEDLRRRWPAYAEQLLGTTPFRAVVALPLLPSLAGHAAMELFFVRPDTVTDLDVFEALAVGELISCALSDAAVWSEWSPTADPEWLYGDPPHRRAEVWEAMGRLVVELVVAAPEALALLRAHACGSGRSVDDVAVDLLADRLRPDQLHAAGIR